ncbi:fatty acid oxidation complex subunit alpha FadB [Rheinheimera sp. MM224]|jgi:3-hydroxyacyl-CoA dehydrogenase/enoyl-CoA hydratase/3-hydroxybutyryl-CoA epimerase/enoyl-CoA isomerase|uniref:fatty acid oxidation complex subunit alpha FadB n=1 Tax=Rheinheimera sp. MM224 TaxID=3019969 RepID=UPI0021F8F686|nr:fatty acid oxidation complex subunit alpha FadB [Rheinheimera sp. MM224]CAI3790515.1 Fatty acid oxidation complex subunit alpha [Rheinheimera sp. MM224]
MIYQSNSITVAYLADGIAEFTFNATGSVNKFDQQTLADCRAALNLLHADKNLKGVIYTSGKDAFIVGADITEFLGTFQQPEAELIPWIKSASDVFDLAEDLPVPTIAAIRGFALGGGFEWTLTADYRVADTTAKVGLPEVKLGLMPGFGGSVRLPRIIGADGGMEWITTGKERGADAALKEGAIDAVVAPEKLKDAALSMIKDAIAGKLNWQKKRAAKLQPLKLNKTEAMMSFNTAKGMVFANAGKHYPAPMVAVETIEAAARLDRAGAVALENASFAKLAKTTAAAAQIGLFLNDQLIKGKAKKAAKVATKEIKKAAVLGAGIMGGGIAYQSALKGVPVVMKDIADKALELGMGEATKLLNKQVERKKLDAVGMAKVIASIQPTLSMEPVKSVDIVVEAVVENPKIKGAVLKEVEELVAADAIITSNTSTISIDSLAANLKDPSRFCGMHFFNPVHQMPLVEVIRGKDTSEETVAAVVAYAARMGKSPIVVNDCPGFYVNRVLFPYFAGFSKLVLDGADFAKVDKVMEKTFGWPMGPAYLLDVVGLDTAFHCTDVMAAGFPTRMGKVENDPVALMYQAQRYGQKNGVGFYAYSKDAKGKPKKDSDAVSYDLLAKAGASGVEFSADDIIARCMVPMINEVIRCLEEGIVASAAEADMGLIYGLGFPPFRGGPLRYADTIGLANFVALADKYAHLGEIYQVTDKTRAMAASGAVFYPV